MFKFKTYFTLVGEIADGMVRELADARNPEKASGMADEDILELCDYIKDVTRLRIALEEVANDRHSRQKWEKVRKEALAIDIPRDCVSAYGEIMRALRKPLKRYADFMLDERDSVL
jgi:hypothetical protein